MRSMSLWCMAPIVSDWREKATMPPGVRWFEVAVTVATIRPTDPATMRGTSGVFLVGALVAGLNALRRSPARTATDRRDGGGT